MCDITIVYTEMSAHDNTDVCLLEYSPVDQGRLCLAGEGLRQRSACAGLQVPPELLPAPATHEL